MSDEAKIWLSRDGKNEGPFTPAQIEAMKASGEYSKYAYIWDSATKGWLPTQTLPPPPASPPEAEAAAAPVPAPAPAPAAASAPVELTVSAMTPTLEVEKPAAQQTRSGIIPPRSIEAAGTLNSIEAPTRTLSMPSSRPAPAPSPASFNGPVLSAICHDNRNIVGGIVAKSPARESMLRTADHPEGSPFRKGSHVMVNLLDETSGRIENASAEIVSFHKVQGGWEYRLRWKTAPQILA